MNWLSKITSASVEVLSDAEVYLFGSIVEGKATLPSDIDVLILTDPEKVRSGMERAEAIAKIEEIAGLPLIHPFELHLMSKEEFVVWVRTFKPTLIKIR